MRRTERALLLIGLLAIGWVAGVYVFARLDHARQNRALDAERARRAAPREATDVYLPTPPQQTEERPVSARTARAEGTMLGRVEVPRLGLSAIVREGVEAGTLRRAVGHVPETSLPGEDGNIALAAHRDTHFKPLRHIRRGDRIRVVTADGDHEYRVSATRIVTPEDVSVLDPTPKPTLTLITCYPFNYVGSAPKRFIVRAERVTQAVAPAVAALVTPAAPPLVTASVATTGVLEPPPAPPRPSKVRAASRPHAKVQTPKAKTKSAMKRGSSRTPVRTARTASVQKEKPKSGWRKFFGVFKPKARPRAAR